MEYKHILSALKIGIGSGLYTLPEIYENYIRVSFQITQNFSLIEEINQEFANFLRECQSSPEDPIQNINKDQVSEYFSKVRKYLEGGR